MSTTFIKSILVLSILLSFSSCYSDQIIDHLDDRFENQYLEFFTADVQEVSALASLKDRLDSLQEYQQLLLQLDTNSLSTAGRAGYQKLLQQITAEWNTWEPYQLNPALYNLGGLLKQQLTQGTETRSIRFQKLLKLLDGAKSYYNQAQQNLVVQDVSLFRLAAQKQYVGLLFLNGELQDSLANYDLTAEESALIQGKVRIAGLSLKDYLAFCESGFLNYRDSTHYVLPENYAKR